ncbi:MAG: hypothetical protein O9284_00985 [Steroidobacteraceae bacterium]|jgi:hypothetical protein|nr:hypothetical protein [Steroidobacteraceae bacterium]
MRGKYVLIAAMAASTLMLGACGSRNAGTTTPPPARANRAGRRRRR